MFESPKPVSDTVQSIDDLPEITRFLAADLERENIILICESSRDPQRYLEMLVSTRDSYVNTRKILEPYRFTCPEVARVIEMRENMYGTKTSEKKQEAA